MTIIEFMQLEVEVLKLKAALHKLKMSQNQYDKDVLPFVEKRVGDMSSTLEEARKTVVLPETYTDYQVI